MKSQVEGAVVRHATAADVDGVAALEAACFPPAEAATRAQFQERIAAFGDHFWLVELDGRIASMVNGMCCDRDLITDELFEDCGMHREDSAWQHVFGVATLPEYRGRGLASLAMDRAIEDARSQGRRGLVLTCKDALVGFYEQFGYRKLGVSQSVHGGAVWYDMRLEF